MIWKLQASFTFVYPVQLVFDTMYVRMYVKLGKTTQLPNNDFGGYN